jgi:hypothetical protein
VIKKLLYKLDLRVISGIDLCTEHEIDEEELVETWTAFSAMHLGYTAPTVETLARMEREMLNKSSSKQATRKPAYDSHAKKNITAKNNMYPFLTTLYKIVFILFSSFLSRQFFFP